VFLLVPAYPGSLGPKAVKRLCVCSAAVDGTRDALLVKILSAACIETSCRTNQQQTPVSHRVTADRLVVNSHDSSTVV